MARQPEEPPELPGLWLRGQGKAFLLNLYIQAKVE
jgi:hypothetical protein